MKPKRRQRRTVPGAYGFRISGLEASEADFLPVPADWPCLKVECRRGETAQAPPPGTVRVTDEHAELWLPGGDRIEVYREPLVVRVTTREPLPPEAILHPYLALPAAIASHWCGRLAFHGGAFAHRGRAWALFGDREAGKSATLGQLMRVGHAIVTDDVLIFDRTTVFAGPRAVDLRQDAAALLGGEELGIVGNRTRWRLRPAPSPPQLPLAGLIWLEWSDRLSIEPLDAEQRLRALIASSALAPPPDAALAYLDLVALPGWRFVRPAGVTQIDAHVDQLVTSLRAVA